jgi:hypothetical protein
MSLFKILLILFLTASCISKLTKKSLDFNLIRPDLVNVNFSIENSKKGLLVSFSYDVKTDLDFMWVRIFKGPNLSGAGNMHSEQKGGYKSKKRFFQILFSYFKSDGQYPN